MLTKMKREEEQGNTTLLKISMRKMLITMIKLKNKVVMTGKVILLIFISGISLLISKMRNIDAIRTYITQGSLNMFKTLSKKTQPQIQ